MLAKKSTTKSTTTVHSNNLSAEIDVVLCQIAVFTLCPPSPSAAEELSCLGVIQKKMTVNATDDSYDKARQSMAQAEEETRSRAAIVIKHGGRYQGRKRTHERGQLLLLYKR